MSENWHSGYLVKRGSDMRVSTCLTIILKTSWLESVIKIDSPQVTTCMFLCKGCQL